MTIIKINQVLATCDSTTRYCRPYIVRLRNGNLFVVYEAAGPTTHNSVYSRVLDPNGTPIGPETLVSSPSKTVSQHDPIAVVVSDGSVVVTWISDESSSSGNQILGQLFTYTGAKGSSGIFTTYTGGSISNLFSLAWTEDKYLIAYKTNRFYSPQFACLSMSGDVVFGPIGVTSDSIEYYYPKIAVLTSGNFVVAMSRGNGDNYAGMVMFDQSGTALTGLIKVVEPQYGVFVRSMQALDDGGFLLIWHRPMAGYTGSPAGLFAQRFDSTCKAISQKFSVDTQGVGDRDLSSVIKLSDNTFVVVWEACVSSRVACEIYAKRFDANCNPMDKVALISDGQPGDQMRSSGSVISTITDAQSSYDKIMIVWRDYDVTTPAVEGKILYTNTSLVQNTEIFSPYASHEFNGEFQISSVLAGCVNAMSCRPAIARLSNGAFMVFYLAKGTGSYGDIYGRVVDPSLGLLSAEVTVNEDETNLQESPIALVLDNGEVVLLWAHHLETSSYSYSIVMGQRFTSSGSKIGPNFGITDSMYGSSRLRISAYPASDGGYVISMLNGDNLYVQAMSKYDAPTHLTLVTSNLYTLNSIALLKGGNCVVSWMSTLSGRPIYMRLYDQNWVALNEETKVSVSAPSQQDWPTIFPLSSGFLATWINADYNDKILGIYARKFDKSGIAQSGDILLERSGGLHQLIGFPDHGFLLLWANTTVNGQTLVAAQRFSEDARPIRQSFAATSPSTVSNTWFYGHLCNYSGSDATVLVSWLYDSDSPNIRGSFVSTPSYTSTNSYTVTPTPPTWVPEAPRAPVFVPKATPSSTPRSWWPPYAPVQTPPFSVPEFGPIAPSVVPEFVPHGSDVPTHHSSGNSAEVGAIVGGVLGGAIGLGIFAAIGIGIYRSYHGGHRSNFGNYAPVTGDDALLADPTGE